MSFVPDPNFSVETAIRRWVLEACDTPGDASLVEQLREIILGIARAHLASGPPSPPPQHLEAEDLAIEFLLHLRKQGNWLIRTKAGLKTEYQRWVATFSNPAHHELWEILSGALHDLARKNLAWRLDAPASNNNHNDAIWTCDAGVDGTALCDLVAFQKAARRIKNYEPPGAGKWHRESSVLPKVIAPSDSKELALDLLHSAGGAICLRDLFEEFKRHVFTFDLSGEEAAANNVSPLSIHPAAMQHFYDLAHERAALIWNAIAEVKGIDIFCDYFIAKNLENRSVTLKDFGDSRRVDEQNKRIVKILLKHLALNLLDALDVDQNTVDSGFRSDFIIESMRILSGNCACRPGKTADPALPIKQIP